MNSDITEATLEEKSIDDILQQEDMLDAIDVQRALCMLTEEVMKKSMGYGHPSDCFCGYGGFNEGGRLKHKTYRQGYRNDGAVLKFIVDATRKAIAENPYKRPEEDDD